jgi:hypothetical protein
MHKITDVAIILQNAAAWRAAHPSPAVTGQAGGAGRPILWIYEYCRHLSRERMAAVTLRLPASILFLAVLQGHAQSTANTKGSDAISPARMRSVLQGMGLEFTEKSSDDSAAFAFPLNGRTVTLLSRVKGFHLSACFENHFAPMKANQWNREHFSTGVYLDEQGCAALRADVNFGGSITDEMIEEFIGGFFTDMTIYAKFLTESPPAPDTPSAPPPAGPADRPTSPIGPMEWSQLGQNTKSAPPWTEAATPVPGLLNINRNISLKYDPDRWTQTEPDNDGHLVLVHSSGGGHAVVIAERIAVSRSSVEDIALANAQSVDPQARIVFRGQRRVNGVDVRFLKIEAEVNAVPMAYWGCFYGGEYGTVQVVAYTAKTLLSEYEKDFMDLLNGLMVSK